MSNTDQESARDQIETNRLLLDENTNLYQGQPREVANTFEISKSSSSQCAGGIEQETKKHSAKNKRGLLEKFEFDRSILLNDEALPQNESQGHSSIDQFRETKQKQELQREGKSGTQLWSPRSVETNEPQIASNQSSKVQESEDVHQEANDSNLPLLRILTAPQVRNPSNTPIQQIEVARGRAQTIQRRQALHTEKKLELWYGDIQAQYVGRIEKNIPHGSGELQISKDKIYSGQWEKGCLELEIQGQGKPRAIIIHLNSFYIGEVKDGRPHGQGEMFEKNQNYYKGFFVNGLRHGDGYYSIKLLEQSKTEFENINARNFESMDEGRIKIHGPWIFGKFQTIVKSEDRINLAKLQEDIESGLIVPYDDTIYVEQVQSVQNSQGKQLYTVVKTLNENVKPYEYKKQHLNNLREGFNQPLSQCSGNGQKTIQLLTNTQECMKCQKEIPQGHMAFLCIECGVCKQKKIMCTNCQDHQDAYPIVRTKNLESYFYRDHQLDEESQILKFKQEPDIRDSQECVTHQISICNPDAYGLVQLHQIKITNPVVLDLKIGRGQDAKEDYLFQKEIVFFDQEQEHIFWFTKEGDHLKLNEVTLVFNQEKHWQKEPLNKSINFEAEQALKYALGLKPLNGQRCQLAQWPKISGNIITINGLNPKLTPNMSAQQSDDKENKDEKSIKRQKSACYDYLTDSKVFPLQLDDEDWEICYRNVSLFIKAQQIDDKIVIHTIHCHDEKTQLVVDTFCKRKPQQIKDSRFKIQQATLEIKHEMYHIDSVAAQVQDSSFQHDLYRSITQQMFNGTPIVLNEEFQDKEGSVEGQSSQERYQTFTIICRRWGCFTFKYQKGQELLQNANHMGKREVTSGFFGKKHYYAEVKQVNSSKNNPIRNSNLLFQLNLYDIASAQRKKSSQTKTTDSITYYFLLPSDVSIEKETDNLLFSKVFGLKREKDSDLVQGLMVVYSNHQSGGKLKTCFTVAYQEWEEAMKDLPKKILEANYIQYPIQARSAFNNGYIDFCNLARDLSQIRLNISPYRFVAFANSNIQKNLRSGNFYRINTYIYFLAEKEGKCSLFRITIRPWESEKRWYEVAKNWKINTVRDNLKIEEDELELIKQAVVLQTGRQKYLCPDFLIWQEIQSDGPSKIKTQSITERSSDTGKTEEELNVFSDHPLVIGPFSQLFLIDSSNKSRVLCIYKSSNNILQVQPVFTHQTTILVLQSLETDDLFWKDEDQNKHHRLTFVDKDYNFQTLGWKFKNQEKTQTQLQKVGQSIDLASNNDFISLLDNKKEEAQFLLTEKTVLFQKLIEKSSTGVELHFQNGLIQPVTPPQKLTTVQDAQNQCSSINMAQWSQRIVAKMFEGTFKYNFITKSSLTQQFNLFSLKEQRMRIDYEDQTFSALEYHIMNSCLLVTFERHVLIFNRLTHMMEEHISCRSNIRVKIVESYNQHKQTAFIWGGDGDLFIYQNGLNQIYEPKLNPFTHVKEAAQDFNEIIIAKHKDLVNTEKLNHKVMCFTLKTREDSSMVKKDLIFVKLTKPKIQKTYDYLDEVEVQLQNDQVNEEFEVNFLLTCDFLVIKYKTKTQKVEEDAKQSYQVVDPTGNSVEAKIIFSEIKINKAETFNKVHKFQTIPLSDWLENDSFKESVRIDYVKPSGNTRVGDKQNVIQISTPKHMILFDLEQQAEVDRILNYNQMTKFNNQFVDTGFTYYDIDKDHVKYFGKGAQFEEIENLEKKEKIITYSTEFQKMNCSLDRKHFVRPTIIGSQLGGCFKLFSRYNLIEIENYKQHHKKKKYSLSDKFSLLDRVDGQFILSLFVNDQQLLMKIVEFIQSKDDESDFQGDYGLHNKLFLKRLMYTLIQGNFDTFQEYKKNQNTLNHAIQQTAGNDKKYEKALPYLIEIFDITSSGNESYLASYLSMEFSDLKLVLQPGQNQFIKEFVARGSIKPFLKLKDVLFEWDFERHKKMVLFGSKSTLLSLDKIKDQIKTPEKGKIINNPSDRSNTSSKNLNDKILQNDSQQVNNVLKKQKTRFVNIQIDIFDIRWLNSNVPEFYQYLAKTKINSFYDNLMIHSILSQSDYRVQIMPRLVHYLLTMVFVLIHNFYLIQSGYNQVWQYFVTLITVILLIIQATQEAQLVQWKGLKWTLVARSITIILTLICICAGIFMSEEDQENLKYMFITVILPSVISISYVAQAIYWMQLIDKTAFYLDIILQSFMDIVQFMFIYIVYLCMGTAAFAVINHNMQIYSVEDKSGSLESTEDGLISERFGITIVDTFVSQWLLGLGSDELLNTISNIDDNSLGLSKDFLYIYFLLGTLIVQIVMINTLIAILSDSFSRVMERRAHSHHAIKARTEMYADFMSGITLQTGRNKFTKEPYIYVIKPTEEHDQDQEWEGAVSLIVKQNNKTKKNLQDLIEHNQKANTVAQEKLNVKVDELKDKLDKIIDKLGEKEVPQLVRQSEFIRAIGSKSSDFKKQETEIATTQFDIQGRSNLRDRPRQEE